MFRHTSNNDIPSYKPTLEKMSKYATESKQYTDSKRRAKIRTQMSVGDKVLVKNIRRQYKMDPFYETRPYNIVKVYGRRVKVSRNGNTYIRNNARVKPYIHNPASTTPTSHNRNQHQRPPHSPQMITIQAEKTLPLLTDRPKRIVHAPNRYRDYELY